MRSWSPSYFSRWCTLWVVYVGLRALLLSLSLKAFCDLLTWGVRSQTRALIAWAGISTTPSGWTAIFLKPCVFFFLLLCLFFHAFFCTWLNNWSNHWAVAWFGFFLFSILCIASPEFPTGSSLGPCLIHPEILPVSPPSYSFICFVSSPIWWSCLLLWSPPPPVPLLSLQ